MFPTRVQWLALLMTSESNQAHEWALIGWSVRNRQLSGRYSKEIHEVVLQKAQYSYFNEWTGKLDRKDLVACEAVYEKALQGYAGAQHTEALACAEAVLAAPLWQAPFGRDVLHYYSPVSMKPKGSVPEHFKGARTFTPAGVDPERFVFGAGIK